jgi:hypothetical protein
MPFDYDRDDAKRIVTVTMRGSFAIADVLAIIARQRSDHTWGYAVLVDLRLLTGEPTIEELRRMASQDVEGGPKHEPRGPLALVVTDPVLYQNACAYVAVAESTRQVDVFRDRTEAEAWLAKRMTEPLAASDDRRHRRE